jgi:hypothetical protein
MMIMVSTRGTGKNKRRTLDAARPQIWSMAGYKLAELPTKAMSSLGARWRPS